MTVNGWCGIWRGIERTRHQSARPESISSTSSVELHQQEVQELQPSLLDTVQRILQLPAPAPV
jgi:hypothetical protein